MKKLLLTLLPAVIFAGSNSAAVVDPFAQMDKLFEMQMRQMQQMQKEMDALFRVFEQSNFKRPQMPVIYSSGGMMSSGLKDKGDYYELDIKIAKAAKTDLDVKTKDGMLTVKVSQSSVVDKNSTNHLFRSQSMSTYLQSFTLPKDADADKITQKQEDDKIVITIPKKKA